MINKNEEIIKKLQQNKKIQHSLDTLFNMSKKYKTTFMFGDSKVVLDNRPKKRKD